MARVDTKVGEEWSQIPTSSNLSTNRISIILNVNYLF